MDFEWDEAKAKANERKHGVSFDEAETVFHDPLGLTVFDPAHSDRELRYATIGMSSLGRIVIVTHTDRSGTFKSSVRGNRRGGNEGPMKMSDSPEQEDDDDVPEE